MKGAEGKPLLVLGQRGKGRVALLLSDHIWLWARGYEGGGPYTDLLRRLAHWLMKEPDLEEETLKATSRGQTLTLERRSIKDEVEPVTVTAPSGKEETITLDKRPSRDSGGNRSPPPSKASTAWRRASWPASSPSATPTPRSLPRSPRPTQSLAPILTETGGGSFWLGRTAEEAAAASAHRHAARRSRHAWRRLARLAQARRLSREGRAPVPALHRTSWRSASCSV